MALLAARPRLRRALAIGGLLVAASGGVRAHAQGGMSGPSEYAVKAAFLYNFAKFVEWPANAFAGPQGAVTFCILGQDPFAGELERVIAGKMVTGRPVAIRYFPRPEGLDRCHILFVSSSERDRFDQILGGLRRGILTVGEDERFAHAGGIINFTLRNRRVRFQINQGAAARAGLTISARLLELAEEVRGR